MQQACKDYPKAALPRGTTPGTAGSLGCGDFEINGCLLTLSKKKKHREN